MVNHRASHQSKIVILLMRIGLFSTVLLCSGFTPTFSAVVFAQANPPSLAALPTLPLNMLTNPACAMPNQLVLAEYQVWHGLPSHRGPQPYISTDPNVVARHIQAAQAQCIGGFVVNWYGPPTDADRAFEDQATRELLQRSATKNFKIALMYDEGTLRNLPVTEDYTARVVSDLRYASQYFTMTSYLQLNQKPAVFVFPYEQFDARIDWQQVREQLGIPITLIEKDPNPTTAEHDARFDGFYSWVQTSTPEWQAGDWGERYLRWFYATMATPTYANKIAIGGVWPGFDRNMAAQNRYIAQRCGQTWLDTWALAHKYAPPIVMISTWNDFSEATAIENGIIKAVATNTGPNFAGEPTLLSATLNDCTDATYTWEFGDGTLGSGATVAHVYGTAGTYTATAANITTTLTTTTLVQIKSATVAWQEDFAPFTPSLWQQASAHWEFVAEQTAKLCEANLTAIAGKVESEKITVDIDRFPLLRVATPAIDPGARYTIQIFDMTTRVATDVLSNITVPGLYTVDLAEQLQWTGTQSFTINIWMIGESKCAVFEHISIEKSETADGPETPIQVFLPIIAR